MKKYSYVLNLVQLSLVVFFIWQATSYAASETYVTKKLKLGDYKQQNGKPTSGSNSVHWWELESVNLTVDENHIVYILDVYNKKVLRISPETNSINEIILRGIEFPYTNKNIDDSSMSYPIEVYKDGSLIYIVGGSEEYNWTIFDDTGAPIKKNVHQMELYKACNGSFVSGKEILDSKLNRVGKYRGALAKPKLISDSVDNQYLLNILPKYIQKIPLEKPQIAKKTPTGKEIWKKDIYGYSKALGILGIDADDMVYILMDGPLAIVKLSRDGKQLGRILLPTDMLYASKDIMWNNFRVLCDGTVYYFPPVKLSKSSKNKGLNEYSIYIFEKK